MLYRPAHACTVRLQNQTRFEASGVCFAKDYYWVVFDSLRSIGRVNLHFSMMWVTCPEPGPESCVA